MASGSRHLSRIRGTAAGISSKNTGQAARIRELTARSKIHPIWETTSRSSSGEAAVIDQRIMAMQEATESKCAGLHDDNAMNIVRACEPGKQLIKWKPHKKFKEKIDEYSSGNFVNMAKVANYFHVSIAVATNHGRFLGYLQ